MSKQILNNTDVEVGGPSADRVVETASADREVDTGYASAGGHEGAADNGSAPLQPRKHRLAVALFALLAVLTLLGLSLQIVLLPVVTSVIADNTVNDELSSLDHDALVAVAEQGREFVVNTSCSILPTGTDARLGFTPDVVEHLEDVRQVLALARIVTFALCVAMFFLLVFLGKFLGRRVLARGLFAGGLAAVASVFALLKFGLISFEALFTAMHKLLFADGTWTFAADSLLICAYPLPFWIAMAAVWAGSMVILGLIALFIGVALRRSKK